jgi:hypothetical protein
MLCGIKGNVVDATLIQRGGTQHMSEGGTIWLEVEHDGQRYWVRDDEGDGRKIATDCGPMKPAHYLATYKPSNRKGRPDHGPRFDVPSRELE